MWKRVFVVLFSLHLILLAGVLVWFFSLPKAGTKAVQALASSNASGEPSTAVEIQIDQNAANLFLAQALANQPELSNILSSANVSFGDTWTTDLNIKVDQQVVPFTLTCLPTITNGNLDLQIVHASIGGTTMTDTFVNILQLLHLPSWITFDPAAETIHIDFADLPGDKVKVHLERYSAARHTLTAQVVPMLPTSG
ncbi:DUF2140 family protein [Alicyclobacillus cycloheptanicus]|uniref:Uncharacterized protein YpmS n=1 Tax=Alicyclobacillus cycloheptanicus TaxID=1457 RepID=A0ABT9XLK4_9BACL|nr:DUF2140 family protein [Alicyclobacillus cycloheptanicus]MDQ0191186.1 uncharacterized protein YpmS [Alicyclobacillus cycloheptanicus]WDM02103.1 DUF2140 family protein [Alicyclobacillus cycloheptanicus]